MPKIRKRRPTRRKWPYRATLVVDVPCAWLKAGDVFDYARLKGKAGGHRAEVELWGEWQGEVGPVPWRVYPKEVELVNMEPEDKDGPKTRKEGPRADG